MAFIATIAPGRATGETREAYRYMREVGGAGTIANVVRLFSLRPASMRRMIRSWELAMWMGGGSRADREFLAAAVSRLNACRYCTDAHEAFLQAAGGAARRVADVIDGRVPGTALEAALVALARKSCEAPARLVPGDLAPLRALVGDEAVDYAFVVGAFHFINRVADLLHVDPEIPGLWRVRAIEPVRRLAVRAMALVLGRMDLRNRAFDDSFERVVAALPSDVDRAPLAALGGHPRMLEAIRLSLDERDLRSSLGRATLARVHAAVEGALPASVGDVQGAHERPGDPELAFAFVGTRYAHRTTAEMIEALRGIGYDDLRLLDLAIAVADANQWARTRRLLDLPAGVYSLAPA